MKKHVLAIIAVLLGAAAMLASPPKKELPLKIDGDTVIVVKTLPCTVTAAPGADFYFWNLPAGVVGTGDDNVLTVTAAPQGESTIKVTAITFTITVDKDGKVAKKKTSDSGSIVLTNGMKPPVPPTPPDPFTASLQTAYNADQDADRAASLAFLAAAYKQMAAQVGMHPELKTNADWVKWMKAVVEAQDPTTKLYVGLDPTKLKTLRTAVGADISKAWGGTAVTPLDVTAVTAELNKIANALSGVK